MVYVPEKFVKTPLLALPAFTQMVAVPPLTVTESPDQEIVTPSTVTDPEDPWTCVHPPPTGQLPATPRAGEANTAKLATMRVAAETAIRPAAVSRLLWFVLRCAGIFPTSIVSTVSATGGHLCPPLVILRPLFGLLHRLKVPDCRKPFVLTCGSHPLVARSVRARCA
jgi:hypothetical protein